MLQLLLFTETLTLFKRLVLPMALFIYSIRGVRRLRELGKDHFWYELMPKFKTCT